MLEIEDGSEAHRIDADFATSIEDMGSEQKDLPKMTFLVAGTAKGHLVLYDINGDGEIYTHFIAHKDPITRVHMDKSRSLLICMVKDESLIVVSVRHEQTLQNIALRDEETVPNAITCFFPCATAPLVLIGLKTGCFDILNLRTLSRARRSTDEDIIQHKAPITVASYFDRFEIVATASLDCTVKLWTRDKLVLLTEIPFTAPIRAMSFLGREGHLLVGEKRDVFIIKAKAYRLWRILRKFNLISTGIGNAEVDSVRSENGSVSPASLDGSLAESTRSLMSPTDRESGTYASVKDMDEISIWKHILPPEEFEKQRQLGRKSEMRTGLASPIALTDDVSSQKLVKIDAIGKGSEVTGILEDLREEGTANAFVSKKTTKTFKIPRLKDDKDLVIALKK